MICTPPGRPMSPSPNLKSPTHFHRQTCQGFGLGEPGKPSDLPKAGELSNFKSRSSSGSSKTRLSTNCWKLRLNDPSASVSVLEQQTAI